MKIRGTSNQPSKIYEGFKKWWILNMTPPVLDISKHGNFKKNNIYNISLIP